MARFLLQSHVWRLLDLPVVFLWLFNPTPKRLGGKNERQRNSTFKRKGWRAKHNIWFRQKRKKIILWLMVFHMETVQTTEFLPLLVFIPNFKSGASVTSRRPKRDTNIHRRYFSPSDEKNHQKGTEKKRWWMNNVFRKFSAPWS